jgi:FkbM family methyltransferase
MKILYGIQNNYVDITSFFSNFIYIPVSDNERAKIYGDHLVGVLKHIIVVDDENNILYITHEVPYINSLRNGKLLHENKLERLSKNDIIKNNFSPEVKLQLIQNNLNIKYGDKYEEGVEQFMCVKYIQPQHKVLEFGGNIGRTSCVIGYILSDSKNLLVFESSEENAKKLKENRDENKLFFNIEPLALSNKKLMQKDWNTFEMTCPIPDGYFSVNNINFSEFKKKWGLDFDVLVVDCEGAVYQIFKDMPEIITNIKIIILENDFLELNQGLFVHDFLIKNCFKIDYTKEAGWGYFKHCFYQVWVR